MDWQKAYEHLQKVRREYVEIGAAGAPALTFTLNPLLIRYEKGERTEELYNSMMSTE